MRKMVYTKQYRDTIEDLSNIVSVLLWKYKYGRTTYSKCIIDLYTLQNELCSR